VSEENLEENPPLDVNRLFFTILKQFGPFECSAEEFTENYISDFEEEVVSINFSDDLESVVIALVGATDNDVN
jgi:hypothetical protein